MVASARRLLVDFSDRTKINCQFKISGTEKRLSRDEEIGIYRIIQEALWNIEHHATRAKEVMVTFTFVENVTSIQVSDDGVGFNVQTVISSSSKSHKLGLVGMQERASLMGGELNIYSIPGKGTVISVSIPTVKEMDNPAE